jgi:hypothetical protein
MKKLIPLALAFSILTSQAAIAQKFVAPDILVETRLDSDWSGILMYKISRLMKNMGQGDPFNQKFSEPLIVSEAKVKEYLNPAAENLLKELGHLLNMDFLNGQTQVTLHGLGYNIRGLKTEMSATEDKKEGLSVTSDFSASKVRVAADKITLSLYIPGKNALPVINIEVIKPVITATGDKLINFLAKIQVKDKKDSFNLFLEDADFSALASGLVQIDSNMKLDFESIKIPQVSIKIGNKEIKFDPKKIEALIISKKDGLKGLLVGEVSSMLTGGVAEDLLGVINKVSFNKKQWVDSSTIQSMIRIDSFTNPDLGRLLEIKISGDFCAPELYKQIGERCIAERVTKPVLSRITQREHLYSMANMRSHLDFGDANIVVSISEDYVNKVLVGTYDAGLWDDMLKAAGLEMGPNKVSIRMDEKGSSTGTLIMDILYTPKKIEQLAVGAKQVRFPLVMKVGLRIKQDKNEPIFVIRMAEVDTSDETLTNGIPSQGIISNIHTLRMKKKILKSIQAELIALANKDVLELRYPELRGLGLDKVDFVSDGNGRMNALMLLKPL